MIRYGRENCGIRMTLEWIDAQWIACQHHQAPASMIGIIPALCCCASLCLQVMTGLQGVLCTSSTRHQCLAPCLSATGKRTLRHHCTQIIAAFIKDENPSCSDRIGPPFHKTIALSARCCTCRPQSTLPLMRVRPHPLRLQWGRAAGVSLRLAPAPKPCPAGTRTRVRCRRGRTVLEAPRFPSR